MKQFHEIAWTILICIGLGLIITDKISYLNLWAIPVLLFFIFVQVFNPFKRTKKQIPVKHDIAILKNANALSTILTTSKINYQFDDDKDALIAFMVYTFLGGKDVRIEDDMARLMEKQLRIVDFYLDTGQNTEVNSIMKENDKKYVFIPFINVSESLHFNSAVLDMYKPSIPIKRDQIDSEIKPVNLIALPINEFYRGTEFNTNQILIVEQNKFVNEVISYNNDNSIFTVNGRILFATSKVNYIDFVRKNTTVPDQNTITKQFDLQKNK